MVTEHKKHPIKRLDTFKLGDWVVENLGYPIVGKIEEFGVNEGTGYRYAYVRKTDGKKSIASLNYLKHLEPELIVLLTDVNKE